MNMWLTCCVVFFWIIITDDASTEKLPSPKIVGGQIVTDQWKFAFMVSIRVNRRHICGGSIIDYRHVLTAAHCCFDHANKPYPPQIMSIAAGNLNIRIPNNASVVKGAMGIFPHHKYNSEDISNDIAVIRIRGRFDLWNQNITSIPLANLLPGREYCTICGWGITQFNTSAISYQLLSVDVPIISQTICRSYYPHQINSRMICAGGNGRDSCQGDSGGPLVCRNVLVGIVSWGSECGVYPGVYTAVAPYKSWIRKYIDNSSSRIISSQRQAIYLTLQIFLQVTWFYKIH